MTFVLIALGVAILMAVAKDKARRFPEPQKYRDGRTEIVHRPVQKARV